METKHGAALPFIWPTPGSDPTATTCVTTRSFDDAARSAVSIFGVVSSVDSHAVDWMEGFLADRPGTKLRLVLSLYPACRTSRADLQNALRLVERHGARAAFRVYPEEFFDNRSSNLICMLRTDGSVAVSIGPTQNLGFTDATPSQANVATSVSGVTFEACRNWFDYLWAIAGPLRHGLVTALPGLIVPEGDCDAAALWGKFRASSLQQRESGKSAIHARVDGASGVITLVDGQGCPVASPTDEIGIPKLDPMAECMSRLFERGALVSVDKVSRLPPLEARVKPEWFGVDSFRQAGVVRSETAIRVAPFSEPMRRKVHRMRRATGDLLARFSFPLADNVHWIPKAAIPLFEQALTAADLKARRLLEFAINGTADSFLAMQRDRIRADAQQMYEVFHPRGKIPKATVDAIFGELRFRLQKVGAARIVPRVTYAIVAFNSTRASRWSSPWAQALSLLRGVSRFPREVLTNRFFLHGIGVDEDAFVAAMNVVSDALLAEPPGNRSTLRAKRELELIRRLDSTPADLRDKCRVLWALVTAGNDRPIVGLTR